MEGHDGVTLNRWSDHPYFFINGELDFRVIKSLDREMSYFVQDAQRSTAFKEGRWDGRESLLHKSRKGVYFFPAGMIDSAMRVFKDFEVEYTVQNITLSNVRKKYAPLNLKWTSPLNLYDYQTKAVIDIQTAEGGTICLPTGAGKTLIMLRIAYEYDLPFIVIVHTKELLYQWERTVKEYFGGYTPGLVGDGNNHFDKITIAMLQTVHQMINKGDTEHFDYPVLFFDECFPYDTLIQTENGAVKIGDIVENRKEVKVLTHTGEYKRVIGWHKKPITKQFVKISYARGSVVCTEDHKILTDGGFVKAKYINCGDVLYNYNGIHTKNKRGFLQNLREIVFNISSTRRARERSPQASGNEQAGLVQQNINKLLEQSISREHFEENTKAIGYLESTRIDNIINKKSETNNTWESDGGYEHILSNPEKQVSEVTNSSQFVAIRVCSVEILGIKEYNNFSSKNRSESRLWGIFDNIFNTVFAVFDRCIRYCNAGQWKKENNRSVAIGNCGSDCSRSMVYGRWVRTKEFDNIFNGNVNNTGIRTGVCVVGTEMGNKIEALPSQRNNTEYNAKGFERIVLRTCESIHNTVNEIQDKTFVYDLTVEDNHTYVADGIVVSNCHRVAADTAYTVAMQINAPCRIGSSATPTRIDGKEKKLWAAVGEIKSRITATELIERGILAKPKFVFLTPPAMFISRGTKWHDAYLQGVVLNQGRNDLIIKTAKELASQDLTVYVHVERIDHGEMLHGRLPGSVFLSGVDNSTRRQLVLREFEDGKIKILVSTLLREGVSINSMNSFIAAGGMKSPIGVIQRIGRALRIAPGKTDAIIVDFRDSGRFLSDHWAERYETYRSTFGEYCP